LALRDLVQVDERERSHSAMELADARLQEALALLGRLVLGVLPQVSVLASPQDLLGQVNLQLVVERPDLFLEPLLDIDHAPSRPRKTSYYHGLPRMAAASEPIRSRANPRYRRFQQLKQKGSADLCLLEGPKLVDEALLAAVSVVEAVVSPRAESVDLVRRLLARFSAQGTPVHRMDASLVASLSDADPSQGLSALPPPPLL